MANEGLAKAAASLRRLGLQDGGEPAEGQPDEPARLPSWRSVATSSSGTLSLLLCSCPGQTYLPTLVIGRGAGGEFRFSRECGIFGD